MRIIIVVKLGGGEIVALAVLSTSPYKGKLISCKDITMHTLKMWILWQFLLFFSSLIVVSFWLCTYDL